MDICTSTSISLSSRSPFRNFWRILIRVASPFSESAGVQPSARGMRISSTRFSAASTAFVCIFSISTIRVILTAVSAKSRIIDSTSRPTYPTSVNFVASILINGALASLARRRAISVLPTPVGPIIKIFLGVISSRNVPEICWRRHRLRSAIATERFALA